MREHPPGQRGAGGRQAAHEAAQRVVGDGQQDQVGRSDDVFWLQHRRARQELLDAPPRCFRDRRGAGDPVPGPAQGHGERCSDPAGADDADIQPRRMLVAWLAGAAARCGLSVHLRAPAIISLSPPLSLLATVPVHCLPENPAGSGSARPQPGPHTPRLGVPLPGVALAAASRHRRSRRVASARGSSAPGKARPRSARAPPPASRPRPWRPWPEWTCPARAARRSGSPPARPPSAAAAAELALASATSLATAIGASGLAALRRPVSRVRTLRPISGLGERQRRQRGDGCDRQQRQVRVGGPHGEPGNDRADREDAGQRAWTGHVHGCASLPAGAGWHRQRRARRACARRPFRSPPAAGRPCPSPAGQRPDRPPARAPARRLARGPADAAASARGGR